MKVGNVWVERVFLLFAVKQKKKICLVANMSKHWIFSVYVNTASVPSVPTAGSPAAPLRLNQHYRPLHFWPLATIEESVPIGQAQLFDRRLHTDATTYKFSVNKLNTMAPV